MVLLNETIQWSCSGLRSLESLQRSALRVSAWTKLATAQKIGGWLVKITGPSGALTKFIKIAYLFGVKIYIYIYTEKIHGSLLSLLLQCAPFVCWARTCCHSRQAQGLLNQNAMLAWPNVQVHNCCTHNGVLYLTRPLSLLNLLFVTLIQMYYLHVELNYIKLL